jgi:hypothetical protein
LHHGQPEASKILINKDPDLGQRRQFDMHVHAIAACTWS